MCESSFSFTNFLSTQYTNTVCSTSLTFLSAPLSKLVTTEALQGAINTHVSIHDLCIRRCAIVRGDEETVFVTLAPPHPGSVAILGLMGGPIESPNGAGSLFA